MEPDDVRPKPAATPAIGEDLTALSVAELEQRIERLKSEIIRVEAELVTKRTRQAAAQSLFKS